MTFEPSWPSNAGDNGYVTRHEGVPAYFTEGGVDFAAGAGQDSGRRLHMAFFHASPGAKIEAQEPMPGKANYFQGSQPDAWRSGVPSFGQLAYRDLYAGIDLLFHGDAESQELEHDFVVRPGGNPADIRFRLTGADRIQLNRRGELVVTLGTQSLVFHAPVAWQDGSSGRREVSARFQQMQLGVFGFKLGAFDRRNTLTIDPVLAFATYLDGSGQDNIRAITTDAAGNIYVAGNTTSTNFPLAHAEQSTTAGTQSAFIAKLDPAGHSLLWSTYLGGASTDTAESIAVDASGNVVVGGVSSSSGFPSAGKLSTANAANNGSSNNFIASLTADGSTLRYAGFLGTTMGSYTYGYAHLSRVAFDPSGAAYIAGTTQANYPYTSGAYGGSPATYPSDETLFLTKVLVDGAIAYAATIPESPVQPPSSQVRRITVSGLAVTSDGSAVLAGTAGNDVPVTPGVVGATFPNNANYGNSGFVLKLNPAGSALSFSTYLPGTDEAGGLAVEAEGTILVSGSTAETNLPTTSNAYQRTLGSSPACNCIGGYLLRLKGDGTQVLAATYFSSLSSSSSYFGAGPDGLIGFSDVGFDASGNVVVGGSSAGSIPLVDPLSSLGTSSGLGNASDILIVARFSADLSTLQFSTFLDAPAQGLSSTGYGSALNALAVNPQNQVLVAGTTLSTFFPTTAGAFQSAPPPPPNSYSINSSQFIAGIDLSVPAESACYASTNVDLGTVPVGSTGQTNITVSNCGNAPLTLPILTSSDPAVAISHTCNSIAPGASCQLQFTFSPTVAGSVLGSTTVTGSATLWPQHILFGGKGGVPVVYLPSSVPFPDLLVGQSGAYGGVVISNTGNAPFTLTSAVVSGTDFQIATNTCNSGVAPQQTCQITLAFSPSGAGTRNGTLTLTDNLASLMQTLQLTGQGLNTAPLPTITRVPALAQLSSGTGSLYVYGIGFLPNSTLSWNGQALPTSYLGDQELAAQLPQSDLAQVGEASVSVSTPGPGGGTSAPATATIYGLLPLALRHTVYNPTSNLLYATVASGSSSYAGDLVAIDPTKEQVTATLLNSGSPNQLALSDDGSLLYVGLDGSNAVAQLALPSGTQQFTATLPVESDILSTQTVASALAVVPGSPHTWLVGLCATSYFPCGEGVAVYDDSTMRPTVAVADQLTADSLTFVSGAAAVYSTEFNQSPPDVSSFSLSPGGITHTGTSSFEMGAGGGPLVSDGQLIYAPNGQVIDPATLVVKFVYPQGGQALALDRNSNRLFFAGLARPPYIQYNLVLRAVDKSSEVTVGQIQFPQLSNTSEVHRFGADGLMLTTSSGLVFLHSSLVTTAALPAQLSLSAPGLTFPGQYLNTTSAAQTLTVTNSGTSTVTISGVSASGNFAQTNTCVGALAAGASCSINVTFTPTDVGSLSGEISINSDSNPPTLTAGLLGTGLPPLTYTATLSPSYLTFGAQLLNTTSAAQTMTLTNTGTGTLTLTVITVSGDFAQTNTCGATLSAGATCTISTTFTPTVKGARNGALTVNSNATYGAVTGSLSGTGQSAINYTAAFSPSFLMFAPQPTGTTSAPQTVTFTNTGNGTLTISSITMGAGDGGFMQTNNCGSSLPVGANCQFSITFSPDYYTPGNLFGASLLVHDNTDAGATGMSVQGTSLPPISAKLSATALNFAAQAMSTTSAAQSLTVTNTGPVQITLTGITASGDFAVTNNCGPTLASGAACTLAVSFSPTATGTRTGQVLVTEKEVSGGQSATLSGIGTAALTYSATANPASLNFGPQTVATTSAAQTVTVTNSGTGALTLGPPTTMGDFAAVSTCSTTLAAGNSCTVNINFTPSAAGTRTGVLSLPSSASAGALAVPLAGSGLAPITYGATLTPASLDFGSQTVGSDTGSQTLTLTNTGSGALAVSGVFATGDFAAISSCAAALAPGATCSISVAFTPTVAGARTGAVTVADNATSGAQTATLTGVGAPLPTYAATLTPGSLTFGTQDVGSTSGAQTVVLSNTGTAALAISSLQSSGDFAQTNNCGSSLPASGSCTVNITFTPTATGARTGKLTVADNASSGTQAVTLTGNADAPLVLAPSTTGSNSATVAPGSTASYSLSLGSTGYTGSVELSCSGAPANASCLVSPTTLSVKAGQAAPFNVTVATSTAVQATLPANTGSKIAWATVGFISFFGLPLFTRRSRVHGRIACLALAGLVLAGLSAVSGCGGAPASGGNTPPAQLVAPGTYTLTITGKASGYEATESLTLNVH